MKLAGSHDLPYPREVVWEALMDPAVLANTLPGCEALERTDDGAFAGRLRVNVGPVRGEFRGTLELADPERPERYRMRVDGRGPSGFLSGEGEVRLEEVAGGTRLHYDLDARVGGRIAGVGQRVLDSSARSVARQGLEGLERELAAKHGGSSEGGDAEKAGTAGPPSPSQAGFAVNVVRDVLADLVPPERRTAAVALLAFLFGLLLGFVLSALVG